MTKTLSSVTGEGVERGRKVTALGVVMIHTTVKVMEVNRVLGEVEEAELMAHKVNQGEVSGTGDRTVNGLKVMVDQTVVAINWTLTANIYRVQEVQVGIHQVVAVSRQDITLQMESGFRDLTSAAQQLGTTRQTANGYQVPKMAKAGTIHQMASGYRVLRMEEVNGVLLVGITHLMVDGCLTELDRRGPDITPLTVIGLQVHLLLNREVMRVKKEVTRGDKPMIVSPNPSLVTTHSKVTAKVEYTRTGKVIRSRAKVKAHKTQPQVQSCNSKAPTAFIVVRNSPRTVTLVQFARTVVKTGINRSKNADFRPVVADWTVTMINNVKRRRQRRMRKT